MALLGGCFTTLGGQSRYGIGRLNKIGPATESMTFDGSTARWMRGGYGSGSLGRDI